MEKTLTNAYSLCASERRQYVKPEVERIDLSRYLEDGIIMHSTNKIGGGAGEDSGIENEFASEGMFDDSWSDLDWEN